MILTYLCHNEKDKMKCFNCGKVGHLIHSCPGKNKENSAAADDIVDNVSKPAESGPSNAAPHARVTGTVDDRK